MRIRYSEPNHRPAVSTPIRRVCMEVSSKKSIDRAATSASFLSSFLPQGVVVGWCWWPKLEKKDIEGQAYIRTHILLVQVILHTVRVRQKPAISEILSLFTFLYFFSCLCSTRVRLPVHFFPLKNYRVLLRRRWFRGSFETGWRLCALLLCKNNAPRSAEFFDSGGMGHVLYTPSVL
jgi:hypothetical protein